MDFGVLRKGLVEQGYSTATANARIAHDVVLAAIRAAGFRENVTVKGGVVMSGLSKTVRRATMDMDLDFLHYSLGDTAIARFVARLNRFAGCKVALVGRIVELKQQEYRGKRLVLALTDERGSVVRTKVDLGVHTREGVKQSDFGFEVVTERSTVRLLVNSREQIFVEKLKSLLRFGPVSSRYKDVYDMYFLSRKMNRRTVLGYIRAYIFDEPKMLENDLASIIRRIEKIFSSRRYVKALANPKNAWMDEPVDIVTSGILDYLRGL